MKSTIDIQFQIELAMKKNVQIVFLAQSLDHIAELERIATLLGAKPNGDWTPNLVEAAKYDHRVLQKFSERAPDCIMNAYVLIEPREHGNWIKALHNHDCAYSDSVGIWVFGDEIITDPAVVMERTSNE